MACLQDRVRWQEVLVGRLTEVVKLAGPTISCEGSPKDGDVNGEWRTNPHVQSYVLATDQVWFILRTSGIYTKNVLLYWNCLCICQIKSTVCLLSASLPADFACLKKACVTLLY